jgi:hypothetical protein
MPYPRCRNVSIPIHTNTYAGVDTLRLLGRPEQSPLTHTDLPYHTHKTYAHALWATESDDHEDALHANIMARLVTEKGKAKKRDGRSQFEEDKADRYISD